MGLISAATFWPFIMTCMIIESTPGPNMAYLAILSLSDGRKAGIAAIVGIALGLLMVGIAAALGVAALISNSPLAYQSLRIGGVFYLLWLAWDGWQAEPEKSLGKTDDVLQNIKFFQRGLITNLLNPKAAVFYVAILPTFLNSASSIIPQAIMLTIIYVLIATIIHFSIVTLAGSARRFLENDHQRLVVRRILSLALAGIAIWFAWTTGKAFDELPASAFHLF